MVPKTKIFRDRNTNHLCNLLHPIPHKFQQSIQQFQLSNPNEYSAIGVSNEPTGVIRWSTRIPSKKELQEHMDENSTKRGHAQKRKSEKEIEIPQEQDNEPKEDQSKVLVTRPPFPERFTKSKKEEEEKEIFETFRKVEVNIPLLDAIKQIPRYTKFLKEYAPAKASSKKINGLQTVQFEGVLEDVLVQVNELIFPTDFYVLDMREDNSRNSTSILLGRPFLKIARTKIDVHSGTLTMEFDGEIIRIFQQSIARIT
ncbi:UNVERIFIED_CONTAM: hypothetical protein Slati_1497300 [Sesamum latifolium]|uniref:Uncharacterized protein n=1 Tax=Sesamum latifolium TaxID=2727402 RepID=A0AAW2X6F4_9LAMI